MNLKLYLLLLGIVPFSNSAQLRGQQRRLQQEDEQDNGVRLSVVGTVGGGGGSEFTDVDFLRGNNVVTNSSLTVTEVFINGGHLVTCLGMRYSNGVTRQHGNGCNGGNLRTLSFEEGEYVSRVELWSTTQRYGSLSNSCQYNRNFRSVAQVRVTSSNGEHIIVGTTSGHGTNLCRYGQNPQYSRVDVSSGPRFAILGFQGRDGDLIDQAGVVVLEAPRFYGPTIREFPISVEDFDANVDQMLGNTANSKAVIKIHNEDTNRHLTELQDGSITTASTSSATFWELFPVACPDRTYALYANVHSGKICYNIRNPDMDMYLGNNGVWAFAHDGTGEDDILGSYVLEPYRDCTYYGSARALVRCPVNIVSAFYTDRRILADHDDGDSQLLPLTPTEDATNLATNWILQFEIPFDLSAHLQTIPSSHEAIRFRNAANHYFLNEDDKTVTTQLSRQHPAGDFWTLESRACPASVKSTEDCYGLLNEHSQNSPTMLSQAALVLKQTNENCYFGRDSNEPWACRIRIVQPGDDFEAELCFGSSQDDPREVSFVNCDDEDVGFNLEWDLYFHASFLMN